MKAGVKKIIAVKVLWGFHGRLFLHQYKDNVFDSQCTLLHTWQYLNCSDKLYKALKLWKL